MGGELNASGIKFMKSQLTKSTSLNTKRLDSIDSFVNTALNEVTASLTYRLERINKEIKF